MEYLQDKKSLLLAFGLVLLLGGVVYWGLRETPKVEETPNNILAYYYGEECPHCKVINEFLENNKIAEKVSFVKKEVWHNRANAREMEKRAKECGIAPEGMGVPFVYADGKCFVGEPDVKKVFSEKAGLSQSSENTSTEEQK